MRSTPRFLTIFSFAAGLVGAAGCSDQGTGGPRHVEAGLYKVVSCDDLLTSLRADASARVRDEAARLVANYDYYDVDFGGWPGGFGGGAGGGAGLPAPEAPGDAAGDGGGESDGPSHFTDTNTQEEGVDEPDFVKTDGERIFLVHGNEVLVFRSWPANETEQVGAIEIEGAPSSMFLAGDTLVVYSHVSFVEDASGGVGSPRPIGVLDADAAWGVYYPYSYRSFTKLTVLDVSGDAPAVESERYVEGWFRDARRHDQVVRTILESPTWQPQWGGAYPSYWDESGLVPRDEFEAAVDAWLDERLLAIAGQDLGGFLPDELVREGDALVPVAPRCEGFYAPAPGQTSYGMAQILTTDLGDLGTAGSTFVLGHPSVVYASADALVIGQDTWSWSTFGSAADHVTILHAFGLDGSSTTYVGSGAVAGGIRNQFSIDEVEGTIRVAVTEEVYPEITDPSVWLPPVTYNRVVTLEAEDGELVEVGRTPDLAEGERIFSVRYVGDRAYVVTFRQIDPLFVVDLSDASAPEVLGEVEIPGFSTYMHPLSATHLLTIGRYVDPETQLDEGMQLQIFDVSDPTAPEQVQSRVVGGYSSAEYDHKAFVFDAVSNLLAVPVESYTSTFSSTLELFEVSIATGFTPAGTVDHSGLFSECQDLVGDEYHYACDYSASMRRGLFIDDYVYAISYGGLSVHALEDVDAAIATADLPAPQFYGYYPYPFEGDVVF